MGKRKKKASSKKGKAPKKAFKKGSSSPRSAKLASKGEESPFLPDPAESANKEEKFEESPSPGSAALPKQDFDPRSQLSRVDHTAETSPKNRRLDSLANLFAAESVCVAVTIINGKLLVAANEIGATSKLDIESNRTVASIYSIHSLILKILQSILLWELLFPMMKKGSRLSRRCVHLKDMT